MKVIKEAQQHDLQVDISFIMKISNKNTAGNVIFTILSTIYPTRETININTFEKYN